MGNKKNIKRAIFSSVMTLVLCLSMLIGTTYAWFTDTAKSSGNKISSGVLDVDLQALNKETDEWYSITESSDPLFNYENWEPGYTEVKVLRIVNRGTLEIQWKAMLYSETGVGELADVIDVYVKEDVTAYPQSRAEVSAENGWVNVGTLAYFIANIEETTTGTIAANSTKDAYEALGIAFKMQEVADNYYMNKTIGTFDITIVATQSASESDSFGSDYDAGVVNNVSTLNEALAQGGTVTLGSNIVSSTGNPIRIPEGVSATLDLNGYTLTNNVMAASDENDQNSALVNDGVLTITGNGSVQNGAVVTDKSSRSHVITNNGTLTIEDGVFGNESTVGAAINNFGTVVINGGTFASKQENAKSDGLCAYTFINSANEDGTDVSMTINNAVVDAEVHGIFACKAGKMIINGGSYTLRGNNGLGCYVVYTAGEDSYVYLNAGTFISIAGRNNRMLWAAQGGNAFNDAAIATGHIIVGENVEKLMYYTAAQYEAGEDGTSYLPEVQS